MTTRVVELEAVRPWKYWNVEIVTINLVAADDTACLPSSVYE